MAESRGKQLLKQDQLMAKIDAFRAINDELRKTNEELRRSLQQLDKRSARERGPIVQLRARPKPFSQAIMDVVKPVNYITPEITFTGLPPR